MTDNSEVDIGHFVLGAVDVIFAFSLALERRGLLDRAEIVDMLDTVQAQQIAQDGASTKRTQVAALMRQAFDLPVAGEQARARFRVVGGGVGC